MSAKFFPTILHIIFPCETFSSQCMLESEGNNLRLRIIKRLNSGDDGRVCIDFKGVAFCTHQFLRGAFGMLIGEMTIDEINDRIFLRGLTRHDETLLNFVMGHCLKFFDEEKSRIILDN